MPNQEPNPKPEDVEEPRGEGLDETIRSALYDLRQKVAETKDVWALLDEDQYRRGWHHALDRVLELIDEQNA